MKNRCELQLSLADRNDDNPAVFNGEILQVDDCNPVAQQFQSLGNNGFLLQIIIRRHQIRTVKDDLQII
ncbi:hypothetical protein D3C81_1664130 [compost metagenome]